VPDRATSATDHGPALRLRIAPRRVVAVLGAGALLLVAAGVLADVARIGLGHGRLHGLVPLFDLDGEANLPATYAGAVLALCAGVLWLVAAWRRQARLPYATTLLLLSLLLLALAVDEVAQIHELLSDPLRDRFDLDGVFNYAWVLVYGAAVVVLCAILLPRAAAMPPGLRLMVLVAAALYVGGALGFEMVGSEEADAGGLGGATYASLVVVEESLEFAGTLLLLYALLTALRASCDTIQARLVGAGA
jgi:hypothetical protein